jgi:hypothetical protein
MPRWAIVALALLTVGVLVGVAFLAVFGARQVVRRIGEIEIEPPGGDEFSFSDVAACLRKVESEIGQGLDTGEQSEAADPIKAVGDRVELIRGLEFTKPVEPRFLTSGEFTRRVTRDFEREFTSEEAAVNSRLLGLLGAMPAGADLKELISGALGAGVLGFYDDDSGELVVRESGGDRSLSADEEVVLAHELDHALTDQVLDLPAIVDDDDPGTEDSSTGALSLVEGDASLVDTVYARAGLSTEERGGIGAPLSKGSQSSQLQTLPHFIQRELSFPYMEGLQFVCHLFSNGGWQRVDAAYKELPQTSAQILFAERYDSKEAALDPPDPAPLDAPWKVERKFALGAAPMLFLFEAPGGDTGRAVNSPLQSASSWAGGELELWSRNEASAAGIALMQRPGGRLCDAVKSWYSKAFPTSRAAPAEIGEVLAVDGVDQDAVIRCSGTEVRVGIAPDLATARALIK